MPHIVIISSSIRTGRNSHRVAQYFQNYINENKLGTCEILDLEKYHFPLFEERLKFLKNPDEKLMEFATKIKQADGVLIVTPEYNGGYPASLKNIVDTLYDEWNRKPTAIATVSNGAFGGSQVIMSLQFSLWKMKAWTIPAMFPVPNVDKTFDEMGTPIDKPGTDKRAHSFLSELLWCIEAKSKMNN